MRGMRQQVWYIGDVGIHIQLAKLQVLACVNITRRPVKDLPRAAVIDNSARIDPSTCTHKVRCALSTERSENGCFWAMLASSVFASSGPATCLHPRDRLHIYIANDISLDSIRAIAAAELNINRMARWTFVATLRRAGRRE
jgi:hypothetical protein